MAADVTVSSRLRLLETDSDFCPGFFNRLARLDVDNDLELSKFLGEFKYRRLTVSFKNNDRELLIAGKEVEETAVFDDFTLDVWKKYYVEEDVVQIGIFQGTFTLPTEGLFVGKKSGRVYMCEECDDYQEQKIICLAYSLEHFVTRGPQQLIVYNKPETGLLENFYGCFDPLLKDRVLSSFGLHTKECRSCTSSQDT